MSSTLWLIAPAEAAGKSEQGPLSNVRVRCGTLSDNHGAKVLGRGASGPNTDLQTQHCFLSVSERPPAIPHPPETEPTANVPMSASPGNRVRPAPAPPRPAERVQLAPEWEKSAQERLSRFAPTRVERLSAAIVSGGVLWFLHSSFWASLLLLGLPLWRHVDLLAIVARAPRKQPKDSAAPPTSEDERIGGVLDDDPPRHAR